MEKPRIGGYGFLIALVIMLHVGMVWARSDDTATAGPSHEAMIASINDPSSACSTFMRPEDRYREDVNKQRPSTNGVLVAEDMRCRQCRGKCKADNLRCRSQCAGDSACLTQCDERSSDCEALCKQVFKCE